MVSSSVLFGTGSDNGHMYAFGAIPLAAPSASASPGAVDQGQTSSLTSTAVTSGTSPYTYQWFEMAPSGSYAKVGTNSTSYSFVTAGSTTTGSWSFILQVTDSTAAAVNSTAATITVDSALVAPSASASFGTVDQGQPSSLTSTAVSTGASPYTYQWFAKAPNGSYVTAGTDSSSYSFVTSGSTTTGTWSFILQMTDSTGAAMNSTAATITVDSALVAPTVTPAPVKVDQGQTSVLSSSAVTTGSGDYTYQWFAMAPSGSYAKVGTNSTSYSFVTSVSNATGSWSFILKVTDSTGAAMNSTAALVTVNARAALPPWVIDLLIAIVVIAVLLIIILFAWRKRARKMSTKKNQPADDAVKKKQPADNAVEVNKVEIADNTVKFFVAKGRRKKHWVIVKEIPVLEIEHIESSDNELTVTWKGATDLFCTKDKTGSFTALVEQVNGMLEEQRINQQKTAEVNEKNAQRKIELLEVIDKSIRIVDLSFDVLIGLQDKRISWQQIETVANGFGENLNFAGQTIPPLTLEYSKIGSAVKAQLPRDASKEAFNILGATYGYFDVLKPEEDIKENPLNFQTTKTLISAYFMLNDLLLSRFVGDKNNAREIGELEAALQSLAQVSFKVDVEALKSSIGIEGEKQAVIDESRAIFKEQLKQLSNLAFAAENNSAPPSEEDLQPLVS